MLAVKFMLLFLLIAVVLPAKERWHGKKSNHLGPRKPQNFRRTRPRDIKSWPRNPKQSSGTGDGFIMFYGNNGTTTVRPRLSAGPECGSFTLPSDAEGILYSVNNQSGMECLTTIQSPVGTTLRMSCPHFDLNRRGCTKEQLLVRDTASGIVVSGCKREGITMTTTSNMLEILHSRKQMRGRQCTGGFMCTISVGRDPYVTGQCGTYTLQPDQFSILFSNNDGGKRRCNYNIKGATNTNLQLICPVFDLRSDCRKEKLILKDNVSREKTTFCWDDEKPDISTLSNSAKLVHKRSPLRKMCSGGFLCFVGATASGPEITDLPPTPGAPPPPPSRPFCSDCGIADISVSRIVGGQAASVGEYPFIALIKVGGSVCGGSLIKRDWVVTAAHCFVLTGATEADVYLGAHSYSNVGSDPNAQRFVSSSITTHPDYDKISQDNDIALIYLGRQATFNSRVKPICLGAAQDVNAGDKAVVAGWGVLESGSTVVSDILQEVAVDITSATRCSSLYQNTYFISENMICTLTKGKDACQGDSGGPLVKQTSGGRWALVGVVSFGEGCANPDKPGVYTKVSNYINWITTTTGGSSC
ncbi:uncharacterized protein [Macrobrachium rosenbergii]|uniref:uncharacterized protein n=1 Tax=Macrobrachium rosenbergii TaxID=79674 RepID=UPI0034D4D824